MGGLLYVIGMSIMGVYDTLHGGVKKRAKAQEIRSEKLERNQAVLQDQLEQRKLNAEMQKRQQKL